MQLLTALIFFGVLFLASLAGTRALISLLTHRAVIDVPNERSSHIVPKPHGGGIAVVIVLLVGWIGVLAMQGDLDGKSVLLAGMTAGLAVLSFIDDLKNLSARFRLLVQAVAVAAGLLVTVPESGFTNGLVPILIELPVVGVAWLWFVNLFNFMDGIDGITGVETICIGSGVIGLAMIGKRWYRITDSGAGDGCRNCRLSGLELATLKIFIGDVASIPLGFLGGWMLLETAAASSGLSGWAAAILLPGYYLFDATFTLVRRMLRRENIFEAHRQHFYQQATQRGFSHAGSLPRNSGSEYLPDRYGFVRGPRLPGSFRIRWECRCDPALPFLSSKWCQDGGLSVRSGIGTTRARRPGTNGLSSLALRVRFGRESCGTMLGTKRSLLIFLHDTGMAALSFLISLTLRLGQDMLIWPREVVGFGLVAFTSVAAVVFFQCVSIARSGAMPR